MNQQQPGQELLLLEIARLRFAEADMGQAIAAAEALRDETAGQGAFRRALETAIAVCYARPFSPRNRIGAVAKRGLPRAGPWRGLHKQLVDLRNQVYAHTDVTDARELIDLGESLGGHAEQWRPLDVAAAPAIIALCETQRERFRAEAERLDEALRQTRASSSPPDDGSR